MMAATCWTISKRRPLCTLTLLLLVCCCYSLVMGQDGTESPGNGDLRETTPADPSETPGDLEETPGDLEDTPSHLQETPGDLEETPGDLEETPGDLEETPGDLEDTPGDLEDTPGDLQDTPGDLQGSPNHPQRPPAAGNLTLQGILTGEPVNQSVCERSRSPESHQELLYTLRRSAGEARELQFGGGGARPVPVAALTPYLLSSGSPGVDEDVVSTGEVTGLESYYETAHAFLRIVEPQTETAPDPLMVTLISLAATGNLNMDTLSERKGEIMSQHTGLLVCIVFGVVYVVAMPLALLTFLTCYCCCRRCGAQRHMQYKPSNDTRLFCLTMALFVSVSFICVGAVLLLINSSYIHRLAPRLDNKVDVMITDVKSYIRNSLTEANYLAVHNYNITADNTVQDINDIGSFVGRPLQTLINDTLSLDDVRENVGNIGEAKTSLLESFQNMSEVVNDTRREIEEFEVELAKFRDSLQGIQNDTSCVGVVGCEDELEKIITSISNISIPTDMLDKWINGTADMQQTLQNETGDGGLRELNDKLVVPDVKSIVENETSSMRQKYIQAINSNRARVYGEFHGMQQYVQRLTKLDKFVGRLHVSDDVAPIEKTVNQVTIMVGVVIIVIVVISLTAICLGSVVGYRKKVSPKDRSSASHLASKLLTTSALMMMLVGSVLMLCCMLLFVMCVVVQQIVCTPLQDPSLAAVEQLFDAENAPIKLFLDLPELSSMFGKGSKIPLAQLLRSCRDDKALLQALGMDNGSIIPVNISDLLPKSDESNPSGGGDPMSAMTGMLQNMTGSMLEPLQGAYGDIDKAMAMLNASNVNTSEHVPETGENPQQQQQQQQLLGLSQLLLNASETWTKQDGDVREKLVNASRTSERLQREHVDVILAKQGMLMQAAAEISNQSHSLYTHLAHLKMTLQDMEQRVGEGRMAERAQQYVLNYMRCAFGNMRNYFDHLVLEFTDYLGQCRPAYDAYDAAVDTVCNLALNPLNGLWFSLGCSIFFFIPAIVFSILLSKYYKRMPESAPEDLLDPSRWKNGSIHSEGDSYSTDRSNVVCLYNSYQNHKEDGVNVKVNNLHMDELRHL